MASEALATASHQTGQGKVEVVSKLTDDLDEKFEEKIGSEDSANIQATASEQETAVSHEERSKPMIKEEENDYPKEKTDEKPTEEAVFSAAVEPTVEADEKELKNQVDVPDIPEEIKQASSVLDAEETPTIPAAAITAGDVCESGDITKGEAILDKPDEEPAITGRVKESEETSGKIEASVSSEKAEVVEGGGSAAEDVVPIVPETIEAEQKTPGVEEEMTTETRPVTETVQVIDDPEDGKIASVHEGITKEPEIIESNQNVEQQSLGTVEESVSTATNPAVEYSVEGVGKQADKVEEGTQEKATEFLPEGAAAVEKSEEKKEALPEEGSVESSNDLGITADEVPEVSLEGEKVAGGAEVEGTQKDEDKIPVAASIDIKGGDNLDSEKSEKQSNIFSKMKQSLGKVKKALVGKSPSSKTTSAESKEAQA